MLTVVVVEVVEIQNSLLFFSLVRVINNEALSYINIMKQIMELWLFMAIVEILLKYILIVNHNLVCIEL